MKQSSLVASAYPFALFLSTAIIFFTVGFIPAIMLFFGGLICWFTSYTLLSSVIYARGIKRLIIPLLHMLFAYGGYVLLSKANFKLILFGFEVENYEFAYFSIFMGLLMAITTKPTNEEINSVQSWDNDGD